MKIHWTTLADLTFRDEIDFILRKWNAEEAMKFVDLVEAFEKALASNPFMGKPSEKRQIRMFVLSKQTTVFHEVFEEKNRIDIQLFWNNTKDPKGLEIYL
ncbi:type II toxin-antitoxin system RelE/ParE family toxin [Aequorivita capsosiphonis]|uniref:type II toxin-antitoxin system RelE/ParE family toxin n=1 Tax=Aequorivita capsosiphonis TaxID=487317 RepID=UPI00047B2422|nr:type II toxin-antitoxin system RelE/ParE family toxin [Aequorivita capsosiphonis]